MAKMKILIVDDDSETRRVLELLLRAHGYETAVAFDAVSAMGKARKEQPNLILLDLGIPGGDGFMVMERLKSIAPLAHIPIIVLSGRDPQASRERALQAGARAYLQKPPDHGELLAAIQKALSEPGKDSREKA